jgi:hypothetical protein
VEQLSPAEPTASIATVATKKLLYRIRFRTEDKALEVYCNRVEQSDLFGFIEVSGFVWSGKSDIILDPTEQEVRSEFSGVKIARIPMHAIIRIDQVEKSGKAKVLPLSQKSTDEATSDLLRGPNIPIIDPTRPKPRDRKR